MSDRLRHPCAYMQQALLQLLALYRDQRYRRGLLQGAVSFDVITNDQYETLQRQIAEPKPALPGIHPNISPCASCQYRAVVPAVAPCRHRSNHA